MSDLNNVSQGGKNAGTGGGRRRSSAIFPRKGANKNPGGRRKSSALEKRNKRDRGMEKIGTTEGALIEPDRGRGGWSNV